MADEILSPEDMPSSPINPNASSNSVNSLGQSVIPVVNKLQDIFAQLGSSSTIDLPQVAVVGSQSSGKSSVLEALVGRDFLPRGSDICTRRPLVLQLVQTPRRTDGSEISEWGEFLHLPGKRFTDFSAIRKEIQAETEREVGVNKGVSDKQIRLKIYSPNVLNITLVDLPGITKVPVGDQPTDIEARIRTMIMSYIKHETCIILAVSPANADLSNSDALQMARVADADGHRTIGVITKLDIMDRGTDATNFLLGNVIPLRLGYVGVVNRSQADINGNKSIQDALAYEEKFFRSRPVYHRLADRCGIPQLAKKLNHILVQHIRAILPGLKARINAQMVSVVKEISTLGGEITESRASQGVLLLNILTKYSEAFTSVVEGKNEEMSTAELSGGARIHYIFQSIYVKCLELVDPCDDLTDDDIRTAIQNATGPRNALFVPEVPFEVLVRRQIARLLDPSIQCARFIYDELLKIAHRCKALELERFPVLRRRLDEIVGNFLREGLSPAERMIEHLIEMEMDYINTSHPAFIGGSKAVEVAWQQQKSKSTIPMVKTKDGADSERIPAADKSQKSRAIFARSTPSSAVADSSSRPMATYEKAVSGGISSIFGSSESRTFAKDSVPNNTHNESVNGVESMLSMIQLREPPAVLRPAEFLTENESVEITVTKLLLKSYYDIVRKNVQDFVPKAIMHFLVNYAKRDLHGILIKKLYRENLFEEVLQEREEIAIRRKRNRELLRVLQQAVWTLDELPLESDVPSRMSNFAMDSTGLPRASALTPSIYGMVNGEYGGVGSYMGSPTRTKSRKSPHSGEQPLPLHSSAAANGGGQSSAIGASYPTINP